MVEWLAARWVWIVPKWHALGRAWAALPLGWKSVTLAAGCAVVAMFLMAWNLDRRDNAGE